MQMVVFVVAQRAKTNSIHVDMATNEKTEKTLNQSPMMLSCRSILCTSEWQVTEYLHMVFML